MLISSSWLTSSRVRLSSIDHVDHVTHDFGKSLAGPSDVSEHLPGPVVEARRHLVEQQFDVPHDNGQRRSQLVRSQPEKRILHLVEALQFPCRSLQLLADLLLVGGIANHQLHEALAAGVDNRRAARPADQLPGFERVRKANFRIAGPAGMKRLVPGHKIRHVLTADLLQEGADLASFHVAARDAEKLFGRFVGNQYPVRLVTNQDRIARIIEQRAVHSLAAAKLGADRLEALIGELQLPVGTFQITIAAA